MCRSLITLLCVAALAVGGGAAAAKREDGDKNKPAAEGRRKMAREGAKASRPGGRGPRGSRWAGRHGRRRRLTKEQQAELLKVLKERRPGRYRWIVRLRDRNERAYHRAMSRMWWRWYVRWRDKPAAVQEAMITHEEERLRQHMLTRAIQRAEPQEKERMIGELREAIRKAFEAWQVIKEHRLTELEREIQRIRADLKDRARRKEQIVSKQLEDLLANPPRRPRGRGGRGRPTTRPAG